MRTAASSKKPKKKNSDEDRIKRKRIKSSKRRRDPSPSSDSEEHSRSRRKKSRREPKKLEKRRKEPKKSEKRKGRKKRSRRDASVSSTGSDSIRSCSTCRGWSSESDRSRSPIRRTDRKVKSGRGRERVRRSRYRSRSCSISGGGISRSRSQNEDKFKEDRSRRLKSVLVVTKSSEEMDERYCGRDADMDKIIKAYDDFPSSRSNDSYDTGRKRVEVEDFGKESYNTRVEDAAYMKGEGVISSKISRRSAKNSDVGGNNSVVDGSNEADDLELILRQKALENFRKSRGGICTNKGSPDDQKQKVENVKPDSCKSAKTVAQTSESKPTGSLDHQRPIQIGGCPNEPRARSLANPLPQESIVNSPVEKNNGNAMLSLLNDSRSSRLVGKRVPSRSSEDQNTLKHLKRVHESSNKMFPEHTLLAKDTQNLLIKCPQESIVTSPVEKNNGNAMRSPLNDSWSSRAVGKHVASRSSEDQNTLNQLKRVQESSNKMFPDHTLLVKDTQNRGTNAEPGSSNTHGAEAIIADGLASGTTCLHTENQNCDSNEPMVESMSGSQFEQKTFSRVHDGEMVQVSYKVYIPKKTPALARRPLQQ